MLKSRDSNIACIMKQRIQALTQIERMLVFGSRARGDAEEDSDLDIFIELSVLTPQLRRQILDVAWEVGLDQGVVISIFLTSTLLLTNSPLAGNPILRAIQSEGIAV